MSEIDEIKARLDILDIVSENVTLKRSGKNYTGFCPFHANTRTPAFVVWPDSGTWRCFGECNDGGDIFKYVMKREGWDFAEALRYLAERAGIELRPLTPQETEQQEEYQHLRRLLEDATTYFRHQLFNNPAGQVALDYLHQRGLSDVTLELFELGYAPTGWDNMANYFLEKGYSQQDLLDAGLVSERENGGVYDRFRHRIIFPIRDGRGRMSGYGARAIGPEDMPKYLNSPQTALFDKSALLYGLDKARRSIRSEDQVVIVEGYMDVIAPYQAGFTNLVSPMGTALTEEQLGQLKRLTRRMVLALDADSAGAKATMRGLQVARQTLERESDLVFDAKGLLRSEGRLKADIRVTTLPEGMDPDEVVLQDPELWKKLVAQAQPIVAHVMQTLAADQDTDDPKIKIEIARQVMPLIQDLPSAIERDTYAQQLARLLKVDERTLLAEQPQPPTQPRTTSRRKTPQAGKQAQPRATTAVSAPKMLQNLEAHCLSIIIRKPELIYKINRALKQTGLEPLSVEDFQETTHQEIFTASLFALEQDHIEPVSFALDHIPFQLLDQAEAILKRSEKLNISLDNVLDDLFRSILRLREYQLRAASNQLRFFLENAEENDQELAHQYQIDIRQNTQALFKVQKALSLSPGNAWQQK